MSGRRRATDAENQELEQTPVQTRILVAAVVGNLLVWAGVLAEVVPEQAMQVMPSRCFHVRTPETKIES